MNLNRRRFLRAGSMMGVAALLRGASAPLAFGQSKQQLGSGIGPVVPKQVLADPLYNLTSDMLRAENDLNPPPVREHLTKGRDCFSLVFQGPRNLPLRQETYTIQQSRLGSFQLLLVPGTSKDAFGPHYEAVINRLFP